jgi:hypothetical protein
VDEELFKKNKKKKKTADIAKSDRISQCLHREAVGLLNNLRPALLAAAILYSTTSRICAECLNRRRRLFDVENNRFRWHFSMSSYKVFYRLTLAQAWQLDAFAVAYPQPLGINRYTLGSNIFQSAGW